MSISSVVKVKIGGRDEGGTGRDWEGLGGTGRNGEMMRGVNRGGGGRDGRA